MRTDGLSLLTIVTTTVSAAAMFILSYLMGVFPGGFFGEAFVGPFPLWVVCLALIFLQLAVCVGTVHRALAARRAFD